METQAFRQFHKLAGRYPIPGVPTVEEIRRANIALLISEFGSLTALAQAIPTSESQLSQWLHGSPDSKTGLPRGMRRDSCRRIELAAGKPAGWLDSQHSDERLSSSSVAQELSQPEQMIDPPTLQWESVLDQQLPQRFVLVVRDEAMASQEPTSLQPGQRAIFETGRTPIPGRLVLLVDKTGFVCIRKYVERRPGHWLAVPSHSGFQQLDSIDDGLQVLAVHAGTLFW